MAYLRPASSSVTFDLRISVAPENQGAWAPAPMWDEVPAQAEEGESPPPDGVSLTAAISFSSPRTVKSDDAKSFPPSASPFVYREADTFGGDVCPRAALIPGLRSYSEPAFPSDDLISPAYKASLPLPGVRSRLDRVLAEREYERIYADVIEAERIKAEMWKPAKVHFDDDIKVFEYERFDDVEVLDSPELSNTEDGDGLSAPEDVASIPLIPNRRLVGGGAGDLERKRYEAQRIRNTGGDITARHASMTGNSNLFTFGEEQFQENAFAPQTPCRLDFFTPRAALESPSRAGLQTPSMFSAISSPVRDLTDASLSPEAGSVRVPTLPTPYSFPRRSRSPSANSEPSTGLRPPNELSTLRHATSEPGWTSPIISPRIHTQSPSGFDKLLIESIRTGKDTFEPFTPCGRLRRDSSLSNRSLLSGEDQAPTSTRGNQNETPTQRLRTLCAVEENSLDQEGPKSPSHLLSKS